MFVIRTVDYNGDGHREDRIAYEWVFESREDAQHKADHDNVAHVTHLLAMAQLSWRRHGKKWAEPTREAIEARFSETSIGFNYVEEWEFQPRTRREKPVGEMSYREAKATRGTRMIGFDK